MSDPMKDLGMYLHAKEGRLPPTYIAQPPRTNTLTIGSLFPANVQSFVTLPFPFTRFEAAEYEGQYRRSWSLFASDEASVQLARELNQAFAPLPFIDDSHRPSLHELHVRPKCEAVWHADALKMHGEPYERIALIHALQITQFVLLVPTPAQTVATGPNLLPLKWDPAQGFEQVTAAIERHQR